jgi:hypothetical protein
VSANVWCTIKLAIDRVEAAAVEMERALAELREADHEVWHDLTLSERRAIHDARARARRSVG